VPLTPLSAPWGVSQQQVAKGDTTSLLHGMHPFTHLKQTHTQVEPPACWTLTVSNRKGHQAQSTHSVLMSATALCEPAAVL
jgi:hypothetical protein